MTIQACTVNEELTVAWMLLCMVKYSADLSLNCRKTFFMHSIFHIQH